MQEKIKKLKEIIEWVYKMQPVSVDLLEIKEEFNNLYEIIDEQTEKMEEEEYFEFRCLKYEYELNYIYRFEYHNGGNIDDYFNRIDCCRGISLTRIVWNLSN